MAPASAGEDRDPALYRANVGLAVFNKQGAVFLGRRLAAKSDPPSAYQWQFPQGGIDGTETPRQAALRELEEETGIAAALVTLLEEADEWTYYDFPQDVRRRMGRRAQRYRGQRQKWFALRFLGQDGDVRLDLHKPEFSAWRWGKLDEAPALVIPFKRAAYEFVARRFAAFATPA
jgi:putative (di)nucleoside polyphosphate hydrolase